LLGCLCGHTAGRARVASECSLRRVARVSATEWYGGVRANWLFRFCACAGTLKREQSSSR
jgi:hypothetical protein